jgi:Rrf2 family protein
MLQVTKKVEYGLIALAYMSQKVGLSVSAREIAEKNSIPVSLTANILKSLAKHQVVLTRRGVAGGYTLGKPVGEIKLGDVMRAVSSPMHIAACCRETGGAGCEMDGVCAIQSSILKLNAQLMDAVANMSMDEFLSLGRPAPLVSIRGTRRA